MTSGKSLFSPETLVFWGAGATAQLGMPTTAQMGEIVKTLCLQEDLNLALKDAKLKCFVPFRDKLRRFLETVFKPLQSSRSDCDFLWHSTYDFEALRLCGKKVESFGGSDFLTSLYNLIDYGIQNSTGVITHNDEVESTLLPERLRRARNLLDILSIASLAGPYKDIVENHPEKLKPYIGFVESLAELMNEEGLQLAELRRTHGMDDSFFSTRNFYMFSYAIASLNYEPVLLWLLFNAHKLANKNGSCVGAANRQIRLYHDLSIFFGMKPIDKDSGAGGSIWFPCNEPVAKRMNDDKFGRHYFRVGKFFYPHGSVNFRKCPSCGNLNISYGDEWGYYSKSLFAALPFFDGGDEQSCLFCGYGLHANDNSLVMQTLFKGGLPSYLEEIQRDTRICAQKAKHIVLLGYTLPPDDLVWRTAMTAKIKGSEKYCSVVVGHRGPQRWLDGEDLEKFVAEHDNDDDRDSYGVAAIQNARQIFGDEKVRAFTGGIPQVWQGGIEAVREMLYPKACFPNGVAECRF